MPTFVEELETRDTIGKDRNRSLNIWKGCLLAQDFNQIRVVKTLLSFESHRLLEAAMSLISGAALTRHSKSSLGWRFKSSLNVKVYFPLPVFNQSL